jgi:hypothetical protein
VNEKAAAGEFDLITAVALVGLGGVSLATDDLTQAGEELAEALALRDPDQPNA